MYGEGSIYRGDPWYNTYEIAVVGEIIILRLLSAYLYAETRTLSMGAILLLGLLVNPPFYDIVSLGYETVFISNYLVPLNYNEN